MRKANTPAGDWPVTRTEAAGTVLSLRDGAKEAKQKPAAWAGKERKA